MGTPESVVDMFGHEPSESEVRELFAHHLDSVELLPMAKPCHDCAVVCGFYEPMAAALRLLPQAEQEFHSLRWFCHNNPNRACRGNIDYTPPSNFASRE